MTRNATRKKQQSRFNRAYRQAQKRLPPFFAQWVLGALFTGNPVPDFIPPSRARRNLERAIRLAAKYTFEEK